MDDHIELDPVVAQESKETLGHNNDAAAARNIQHSEGQNNIQLKIGITGQSGSGKSSFINAFRGINDNDEGAAPTGSVETTTEVTEYPHPNYPNVILCDLPGIGTPKFPADKYLKLVGFEKFDVFIIISVDRFTENDVKLAKKIKKMGKKFYFVRSKIDENLRAEKRKRGFNKKKTLKEIKADCIRGLTEQGFESPQVFLLSSFEIQKYDFSLLQETLTKELPKLQRNVLLLANPSINLEKKEASKRKRWWHSIWRCCSCTCSRCPCCC